MTEISTTGGANAPHITEYTLASAWMRWLAGGTGDMELRASEDGLGTT